MSIKKHTCFKAMWNHMKTIINLCLNVFISVVFLFGALLCHCLFQTKAKLCVLNLGWLLKIRGNDNRKPLLEQPKGGHVPLTEMVS